MDNMLYNKLMKEKKELRPRFDRVQNNIWKVTMKEETGPVLVSAISWRKK